MKSGRSLDSNRKSEMEKSLWPNPGNPGVSRNLLVRNILVTAQIPRVGWPSNLCGHLSDTFCFLFSNESELTYQHSSRGALGVGGIISYKGCVPHHTRIPPYLIRRWFLKIVEISNGLSIQELWAMLIIMKHNGRKTIMGKIHPPSCQDLKGDVLGVQTSQLERRPVDTVSGLELSLSSGWPGDGSSS